MQKGRRGFLSGVSKMAAMGGAAVLLPRAALGDVHRAGLAEVADEVYIDETHELTPDQVRQLFNRVRQLEQMVAQPTFFNGKAGRDGRPGQDGMTGPVGMQGVQGIQGENGADFHSWEFEQRVNELMYNQPQAAITTTCYNDIQCLEFTDGTGRVTLIDYVDKIEHDNLKAQVQWLMENAAIPQRWAVVCKTQAEIQDKLQFIKTNYPFSKVGFPSRMASAGNIELMFLTPDTKEETLMGIELTYVHFCHYPENLDAVNSLHARCGLYPANLPEGIVLPRPEILNEL